MKTKSLYHSTKKLKSSLQTKILSKKKNKELTRNTSVTDTILLKIGNLAPKGRKVKTNAVSDSTLKKTEFTTK